MKMLLSCMAAVAFTLLNGSFAGASELVCKLYSAKDPLQLLETIKITVSQDRAVSIWHKYETTSYWQEREENEKVLFHSMTTIQGDAGPAKFSVIVIESRFVDETHKIDQTFPPKVYFVDWGKAKFAEITVPLDPVAQVDTRWQCSRPD